MKILSQETNIGIATTVSSATAVRLYNSDSSVGIVTRTDSSNSTIGNFTVPAGEVLYLQKKSTDKLVAPSTVLASKVAYSHMMSYSSYSSSGGGGGGSLVTANNVLLLDANSYSGSGKWLDESSSGNDGTITSSGSGLTYVSAGNASYFDFSTDGTTNRFVMDSGMFNPNADHTFSIWVRMLFAGGNAYQAFLAEDNSNGGLLYRYVNNSGGYHGLNLVRSYQSNIGMFTNSDSLTNNTIYNFTFTRSGNTFTAYINGVQENPNSGSTIGTITSSDTSFQTPNNIGSDQSGVDDLEGRVYHVMAYSNALTASEVLQNFDALKSRYGY